MGQVCKQVFQLGVTMILVRILAPHEFGLLAMANVLLGLATLFLEMGIGNALIQRKEISEEHLSSAFWLNMALGAVFMIVTFLASPLIAMFYGRPELVSITKWLSLCFIVSASAIVHQSLLMRDMDFRSLMIRDTAAVALSGGLGIFLASKGHGVWSLVFQSLFLFVLNTLFLWVFSRWKPQFLFSKRAVADLMGFGLHMTGFQIVNYFARNVDQLLVGRFLGAQSLGHYALAYKLMLFPVQNISWVITRVMFPAFSKIQKDLPRVAENYARMVRYVSLITFPMMLLFFTVAPDLIHLVWGAKWEETIPIVRVLCFCGMLQSVVTVGGSVYLSQGRADLQLRMSLANVTLTTLSILIGLQWSTFGVAVSYTIFTLLWAPVSIYVVTRILRYNVFKIYGILVRNLLAGLVPFVLLMSVKQYLSFEPVVLILTLILAGALIYLSALAVLKRVGAMSW